MRIFITCKIETFIERAGQTCHDTKWLERTGKTLGFYVFRGWAKGRVLCGQRLMWFASPTSTKGENTLAFLLVCQMCGRGEIKGCVKHKKNGARLLITEIRIYGSRVIDTNATVSPTNKN
jgi:hypothetical protein